MTGTLEHEKRCNGLLADGALLAQLPVCDYATIWQWQKNLVKWRQRGNLSQDLFVVVEHPPVMTLGRHGRFEHLLVEPCHLQQHGIALYQTERGGEITYHAPGQLVVYGICDLRARRQSLRDYIYALEQVMIDVAKLWDVEAVRCVEGRGVWSGKRKLGSVGVAVKHGISFHGLALNVDLDLSPFCWIDPCGFRGIEMTNLSEQSQQPVCMDVVRRMVVEQLQQIFQLCFSPWSQDHMAEFAMIGDDV